MVKGSQLSQLKSALNQAGLNRQPTSSKKRKRSTVSLRENDKEKKEQRLKQIQEKLNPFEVKINRLKHDVGGRKLKGVTGKPQQSKQAGIEQRRKSLLKEYELKNRAGAIIDRRFGENDASMTPEERMLERFTKERQRAAKGSAFNLEDEDDLTHYGQSLSKMDDFEEAGLGLDDDDSEDGKIDQDTVRKVHFGGFDDDDDDANEEPDRKKSKAEVMSEVIAKSKQHKFERQLQKQQDAEARHELDQQLDDIRGLLFASGVSDPISSKLADENKNEDKDYDVHVRELALDRKAKPKDRTKTDEELALETKEALEKAERKRLKRMMGEEDDSSDEEKGPSARKKARKQVNADDLEDDFQEEEDSQWAGLGAGLDADMALSEGDEDEDEDRSEDEGEGEGSGDEEVSEDESDDGEAEDDLDEYEGLTGGDITKSKRKSKVVGKELPYTFPCPETHDEFLSIVEDIPEEDVPTVIQRIRALYHPSLAEDNKFKLQALTGVLVEYILHITSPPSPNFTILPSLVPHLHSLTTSYPIESAKHFVGKLKLMQKNLSRGLSKGATSPTSKTWPGTSELAFLWTITYIWPTSDMNHHVVSPARLLMGSYLGLCRVRSLPDLASGLFLSSLFLRYEEDSKRLVPEALNFVLNALLHLAPHQFTENDSVPGSFPCPDLNTPTCRHLRISIKAAKRLAPRPANLVELMARKESADEQSKVDVLLVTLDLLGRLADMYKGLDGFIELFEPVVDILDGLHLEWAAAPLKSKYYEIKDSSKRLLKFARQSRRPLALQAHKPIPIATYIPKFESSSSSYLRKNDPDQERAQASKLRYQYKQERKGAIRELRKDARFLSSVKMKEQSEKDRAYSERMNKVFSSLESEQAEQKKMDREKAREKKRAGRK